MKINDNIEEYDIRSMNAILSCVESISKGCKMLENGASNLEHNISRAEANFQSENMARAKIIMKKYEATLEDAQLELKELLESVNAFSEKLKRAWREW